MFRKYLFHFYWILLLYIIAALTWWFIFIFQQNKKIQTLQLLNLQQNTSFNKKSPNYNQHFVDIEQQNKKLKRQVYSEYITFLGIIVFGAWALFRFLKKEFYVYQMEQNFLMGMTHEFKTPIAITLLNIETLQNKKCSVAIQKQLLASSFEEMKRLNAYYENMMTTIRLEDRDKNLHFEKLNLNSLLFETIETLQKRYPNILFQNTIQQIMFTNGDKNLLQLCFQNLLDNAIKYSQNNNEITIKCQHNNKHIELCFIDKGIGILEQDKQHVFEKFYRGHNLSIASIKGNGLGLYVVKQILKLHNATIVAIPNKPQGSIFKIYFNEYAA